MRLNRFLALLDERDARTQEKEEAQQTVAALRRALADREAVLKLTRKQLRRQTKTSKARHAQLARKDSKAAKKAVKQQKAKVARDIAGAARRRSTGRSKQVMQRPGLGSCRWRRAWIPGPSCSKIV